LFYEFEPWSLVLREELRLRLRLRLRQRLRLRLRLLENTVLRKIFGSTGEKVTSDWRKINKDLHDLYSSPKINRMLK
jgi:hypothetical protein